MPHPHRLCRLCWEVGALSHTVVANGHALSESERTELAFAVAVVRERVLARVAVRRVDVLTQFADRWARPPSAWGAAAAAGAAKPGPHPFGVSA